ncbi:MAG: hypothetical protein WCE62_14130, partial [Polyangiales bacterium]
MLVCLLAPWLTRALLLAEKPLALAPVDLRGVLADASVALLVVGVAGALLATGRWWSRALGASMIVAFIVLTFAMYEFVSAFDSLYAFSHAAFLLDSTFFG